MPLARLAPALVVALLLGGCASGRLNLQPRPEPAEEVDPLEVRLQMAEAMIRVGSFEKALAMTAALREEGYADPRLDKVQASALNGQGLYGETILLLDTLPHRRSAESQRLLGLAYVGAGRHDDAILAFDRAVRRSRSNDDTGGRAELHNNLGFALATAGRHQEAIAAYERALTLNPTLARARNNLGFSLVALERDAQALVAFRAAARLDPTANPKQSDAAALYNLGLGQDLRGDPEAARDSYAAALEAWPDHAAASAALEQEDEP